MIMGLISFIALSLSILFKEFEELYDDILVIGCFTSLLSSSYVI